MKAWAFMCALAALAVSSVHAADATKQVASCDLIKIFSLVKPLESNEDVKKCIAATGYELLPPPGAPTKDQVAKLCATASCQTVFAALQKMDIPDCTISILGGLNMKKVISEAFGQCSSASKGTPAATPTPTKAGTTPSVTPAKAPATTPATTPAGKPTSAPAPAVKPASTPAPTTAAPASAGNAKLPETAPTTAPVPAPAPTSTPKKTKAKLCHE